MVDFDGKCPVCWKNPCICGLENQAEIIVKLKAEVERLKDENEILGLALERLSDSLNDSIADIMRTIKEQKK